MQKPQAAKERGESSDTNKSFRSRTCSERDLSAEMPLPPELQTQTIPEPKITSLPSFTRLQQSYLQTYIRPVQGPRLKLTISQCRHLVKGSLYSFDSVFVGLQDFMAGSRSTLQLHAATRHRSVQHLSSNTGIGET